MLIFQTFVEKFKVSEQGVFKKKNQSTMEPLQYETFKPQETTKYVTFIFNILLFLSNETL